MKKAGVVSAVMLALVVTAGAQETSTPTADTAAATIDVSKLTFGDPNWLKGRKYADLFRPIAIGEKSEAVILDPDDKLASIVPGPYVDVQIGEKDGKPVWLKLKVLKNANLFELFESDKFEKTEQTLRQSGVSTQSCGGERKCTKRCTRGSITWCCEWTCQ